MKTVYVAEDGKQFDDEDECEAYEIQHLAMHLHVLLMDKDGEPLEIDYDGVEKADYIFIEDEESLCKLNEIMDSFGFNAMEYKGNGLYQYDSDLCDYFFVNDRIAELKQEIEKMECKIAHVRRLMMRKTVVG